MISTTLILFSFLFGSYCLAKVLDDGRGSTWILALFSLAVVSVEALGIFSAITETNLRWISLGIAILSLAGFGILIKRKKRGGVKEKLSLNWWEVTGDLALWLIISGIVFYGVLIPLADIDSIGYHAPIVSQMIRSGGVWDIFQAGFVGPNTYFPANHEALQVFLQLAFGTDQLNFLVTLLSFILFFKSLKELGGKIKCDICSLIFLISVVSTPFLLIQFFNFQVDLFLFSLMGSAISFLVLSILNEDPKELIRFFMAFGLALGAKFNALLQGVIFLPVLIYVFYHFRKELRIFFYPLISVLLGGFWYVRNAIVTGNPFYPFGIDFSFIHFVGHKKFTGDMEGTSILDAVKQLEISGTVDKITANRDFIPFLGNLVWVVPALATLSVIVLLVFLLVRRKKKTKADKSAILKVCLILLLYLCVAEAYAYLKSPYTFTLWDETVRYGAVWFALFPVMLAVVSRKSWKIAVPLSLIPLGVFIFNFTQFGFPFKASVMNLATAKLRYFSAPPFWILLALVTVAFVALTLAGRLKKWYLSPLLILISAMALSAQNTLPSFSVKAIDDAYRIQELSGYKIVLPHIKRLRRSESVENPRIALVGITFYGAFEKEGVDPVYVNVDGCLACHYPDYRVLEDSVRSFPNEKNWKKLVKDLKVNYLLVGINNYHNAKTPLYEKEWADNDKQMFEKVMDTNGIFLYKIH